MNKVEVGAHELLHHLDPRFFPTFLVRHAQVYQFSYAVWMQQRQPPHDHCAPVMADKGGVVVSVVIQKPNKITRQMFDVIICDVAWAG